MPYTALFCLQPAQLIPLHELVPLHHPPPLQVLLDIGAGMGMFSLAAAARGHKAYAFELSPKSLASLEASVEFNGFQHLITVHKVGHLLPRAAVVRHTCRSDSPACCSGMRQSADCCSALPCVSALTKAATHALQRLHNAALRSL